MLEPDHNIVSAIDRMIEEDNAGAKMRLIRVYTLLEAAAAAALSVLAAFYAIQLNMLIACLLLGGAALISHNALSQQFYPRLTLNRTAHYWMLGCLLCVGMLWFGVDGGYWAIPLAASSFYVIPIRHAAYFTGALVMYLAAITPLFQDFTTSYRIIAIMVLTCGSTALYSLALTKQQQTLALRSITDPLTGAFNRLYLNYALDHVLALSQQQTQSTIALLDINNFKHINTQYGHDGGDRALIRLVDVVKAYVPAEYPVIRYGGDEFIVVFEACNKQQAEDYINQTQSALTRLMTNPNEIPISFSTGYATTSNETSLEDLLSICDRAMYEEKGVKHA